MHFFSRFITFSLLLAGSTFAQPHSTDTDNVPARNLDADSRLTRVRLTPTRFCSELEYAGQTRGHQGCIVDTSRGSAALGTPLRQGMTPPVAMASLDKRGKVADFFMGDELERANREAKWAHQKAAKENYKTAQKQLKRGGKAMFKDDGATLAGSQHHISVTQHHLGEVNKWRDLEKNSKAENMTPEEKQLRIAEAKRSAQAAMNSAADARRRRP